MPSTKQLRYFTALAKHRNFGAAATACAVTQPALSMQIGNLEQELGIPLVERRTHGLILTAAGQEIATRAANILREVEGLAEFAASCRAPLSMPLRLGVIPTVAPYTLPPLLPLLRQRYSALSLQIREAQTHTLVSELLEAKLDACLAALPLDHPDLEILPLRTDRFLLAVPTGSPLARQRRLTPEALQNHPLLLLEEGHCLRDQALAVCRLQPTQSAAMLGAASLTTLIQLVANGLGITLLPEICTQQALPPGVRLLHFRAPAPTRTLGLAWRRSSARKAEFTLLGQVLQEAWRTKAS